jgi:hypothetical protein
LRGTLLQVPYSLAGPKIISAKQQRETENAQAIGGMRNPVQSLDFIPQARSVGRRLRKIFERFQEQHAELTTLADARVRGGKVPDDFCFIPTLVRRLRRQVLEALGVSIEVPADRGT